MQQLTAQELNQTFSLEEWPLFESVEYDVRQPDLVLIKLKVSISESLKYFAGHFPDQAVLPGVVQIHWAGELARLCLCVEGFTKFKKVKFNSVIFPSTQVSLSLSYKPVNGCLNFVYEDQQQKYSSGTLFFLEQT